MSEKCIHEPENFFTRKRLAKRTRLCPYLRPCLYKNTKASASESHVLSNIIDYVVKKVPKSKRRIPTLNSVTVPRMSARLMLPPSLILREARAFGDGEERSSVTSVISETPSAAEQKVTCR